MKIFITGITGFVGSHLVDFLLKNTDVEIHGLTRWRSSKENIIHCINKINLHYGDLLDFSSLYRIINGVKPEKIVHLASQSFVPYSFQAPISTLDTNIIGTCNLLEVIKIIKKENKYDPIIHICSSSECYGQVLERDIPIKENCPLRPASSYAVSKVGEDMLGYQYWKSYGLKTIRTRAFTHSGPRRHENFCVSNFAKQIAMIENNKQEPIIYVGNLDSVRTFADVRDMVRAYWLLINKCEPGEVYNIGGNITMTVGEMLNKLIKLSSKKDIKIEIDSKRLRPSDVTLQIPCIDKFVKITGWKPEISFEKTLIDILDYWRKKII